MHRMWTIPLTLLWILAISHADGSEPTLEDAIANLRHRDAAVRKAALSILLKSDSREQALAVPSLKTMLQSEEQRHRIFAATALAAFPADAIVARDKAKLAIPILVNALLNDDTDIRAEAISCTEQFPTLTLVDLIGDGDREMSDRARATYALCRIAFLLPARGRITSTIDLAGLLTDGDPEVRAAATHLAQSDDPVIALSVCRTMSRDFDSSVRSTAVGVAGWIYTVDPVFHEESLRIVLRGLADDNVQVQRRAACLMSPNSPFGVRLKAHGVDIQHIRRALRNNSPDVRLAMLDVLETLGPAGAAAIPEVLTSLQGTKSDEFSAAIMAERATAVLYSIGAEAKAGVPWLENLMATGNGSLKKAATVALARIDRTQFVQRRETLLALLRGADGSYSDVSLRLRAFDCLTSNAADDSESLSLCKEAMKIDVAEIRAHAIRSLRELPAQVEIAVGLLCDGLQDTEQIVKIEASSELIRRKVFTERATDTLVAIVKDGNAADEGRGRAAELLGESTEANSKRVVPVLIAIIQSAIEDDVTKTSAVNALAKLGQSATTVVPVLIHELGDEDAPPSLLRSRAMIRALGEFGANARPAVPVLLRQLTEGSVSIVEEAAKALDKIGAVQGVRR